jgi:mRNA-degrading endonuclease YafQ of YafQ-DinJ toxin-antitoxin module
MKIQYHKNFKKQFDKLLEKKKKKVLNTIKIFINDPKDK